MTYWITVDTEHGPINIDLDSLKRNQLYVTEDRCLIQAITAGDNLIQIEINSQDNSETYNRVLEYLRLLDGGFETQYT